jgi:tRNA(Ile)-lysidine synthase TilS/MesJ
MSEIEDNNIWVQGGSSIKLQQQTMLRPLLHHAKKVIEQYCDEQKISYAIDKSNADVTVSQRNQMRHEVVMKMSGQEL